jgi:hypothetical protein
MQNDVVYLNFLYFFSIFILQKYMVRSKFCNTIHLPPKIYGHGGSGPTTARHGGMGRGPLARAHP